MLEPGRYQCPRCKSIQNTGALTHCPHCQTELTVMPRTLSMFYECPSCRWFFETMFDKQGAQDPGEQIEEQIENEDAAIADQLGLPREPRKNEYTKAEILEDYCWGTHEAYTFQGGYLCYMCGNKAIQALPKLFYSDLEIDDSNTMPVPVPAHLEDGVPDDARCGSCDIWLHDGMAAEGALSKDAKKAGPCQWCQGRGCDWCGYFPCSKCGHPAKKQGGLCAKCLLTQRMSTPLADPAQQVERQINREDVAMGHGIRWQVWEMFDEEAIPNGEILTANDHPTVDEIFEAFCGPKRKDSERQYFEEGRWSLKSAPGVLELYNGKELTHWFERLPEIRQASIEKQAARCPGWTCPSCQKRLQPGVQAYTHWYCPECGFAGRQIEWGAAQRKHAETCEGCADHQSAMDIDEQIAREDAALSARMKDFHKEASPIPIEKYECPMCLSTYAPKRLSDGRGKCEDCGNRDEWHKFVKGRVEQSGPTHHPDCPNCNVLDQLDAEDRALDKVLNPPAPGPEFGFPTCSNCDHASDHTCQAPLGAAACECSYFESQGLQPTLDTPCVHCQHPEEYHGCAEGCGCKNLTPDTGAGRDDGPDNCPRCGQRTLVHTSNNVFSYICGNCGFRRQGMLKSAAYRCPQCANSVEPTQDLASPHTNPEWHGEHVLICPGCGYEDLPANWRLNQPQQKPQQDPHPDCPSCKVLHELDAQDKAIDQVLNPPPPSHPDCQHAQGCRGCDDCTCGEDDPIADPQCAICAHPYLRHAHDGCRECATCVGYISAEEVGPDEDPHVPVVSEQRVSPQQLWLQMSDTEHDAATLALDRMEAHHDADPFTSLQDVEESASDQSMGAMIELNIGPPDDPNDDPNNEAFNQVAERQQLIASWLVSEFLRRNPDVPVPAARETPTPCAHCGGCGTVPCAPCDGEVGRNPECPSCHGEGVHACPEECQRPAQHPELASECQRCSHSRGAHATGPCIVCTPACPSFLSAEEAGAEEHDDSPMCGCGHRQSIHGEPGPRCCSECPPERCNVFAPNGPDTCTMCWGDGEVDDGPEGQMPCPECNGTGLHRQGSLAVEAGRREDHANHQEVTGDCTYCWAPLLLARLMQRGLQEGSRDLVTMWRDFPDQVDFNGLNEALADIGYLDAEAVHVGVLQCPNCGQRQFSGPSSEAYYDCANNCASQGLVAKYNRCLGCAIMTNAGVQFCDNCEIAREQERGPAPDALLGGDQTCAKCRGEGRLFYENVVDGGVRCDGCGGTGKTHSQREKPTFKIKTPPPTQAPSEVSSYSPDDWNAKLDELEDEMLTEPDPEKREQLRQKLMRMRQASLNVEAEGRYRDWVEGPVSGGQGNWHLIDTSGVNDSETLCGRGLRSYWNDDLPKEQWKQCPECFKAIPSTPDQVPAIAPDDWAQKLDDLEGQMLSEQDPAAREKLRQKLDRMRQASLNVEAGGKSVCTCGHTGDGVGSQHEGVGLNGLSAGHGACKLCECGRFSWAGWSPMNPDAYANPACTCSHKLDRHNVPDAKTVEEALAPWPCTDCPCETFQNANPPKPFETQAALVVEADPMFSLQLKCHTCDLEPINEDEGKEHEALGHEVTLRPQPKPKEQVRDRWAPRVAEIGRACECEAPECHGTESIQCTRAPNRQNKTVFGTTLCDRCWASLPREYRNPPSPSALHNPSDPAGQIALQIEHEDVENEKRTSIDHQPNTFGPVSCPHCGCNQAFFKSRQGDHILVDCAYCDKEFRTYHPIRDTTGSLDKSARDNYLQDVASCAEEIVKEYGTDEQNWTEAITEMVDSSSWIIYTANQIDVLKQSPNAPDLRDSEVMALAGVSEEDLYDYEAQGPECEDCNGSGLIFDEESRADVECATCNGSGHEDLDGPAKNEETWDKLQQVAAFEAMRQDLWEACRRYAEERAEHFEQHPEEQISEQIDKEDEALMRELNRHTGSVKVAAPVNVANRSFDAIPQYDEAMKFVGYAVVDEQGRTVASISVDIPLSPAELQNAIWQQLGTTANLDNFKPKCKHPSEKGSDWCGRCQLSGKADYSRSGIKQASEAPIEQNIPDREQNECTQCKGTGQDYDRGFLSYCPACRKECPSCKGKDNFALASCATCGGEGFVGLTPKDEVERQIGLEDKALSVVLEPKPCYWGCVGTDCPECGGTGFTSSAHLGSDDWPRISSLPKGGSFEVFADGDGTFFVNYYWNDEQGMTRRETVADGFVTEESAEAWKARHSAQPKQGQLGKTCSACEGPLVEGEEAVCRGCVGEVKSGTWDRE